MIICAIKAKSIDCNFVLLHQRPEPWTSFKELQYLVYLSVEFWFEYGDRYDSLLFKNILAFATDTNLTKSLELLLLTPNLYSAKV